MIRRYTFLHLCYTIVVFELLAQNFIAQFFPRFHYNRKYKRQKKTTNLTRNINDTKRVCLNTSNFIH